MLVGALGMIVMSAIRFSLIKSQTVHEVILNGYYLFFGIVLVVAQLKLQWLTDNFRFLNYHWGRFVFMLFLASMTCTSTGEPFV